MSDDDERIMLEATKVKRATPGPVPDHFAETGHALETMCCTKADWRKWRGREPGSLAHYCDDWDDLPMDTLCEEWPCVCIVGKAFAAGQAARLEQTINLVANFCESHPDTTGHTCLAVLLRLRALGVTEARGKE